MVHAIPLPLGSLFSSRNRFDPRDYERTPLLEKLEHKLEDKLERLRPEQQRLRRKAITAKRWIVERLQRAKQSSQAARERIREASGGFTDQLMFNSHIHPDSRDFMPRHSEMRRKSHGRDDSLEWKETAANEWCLGAEFTDTYATFPRRRLRSNRSGRMRSLSATSTGSAESNIWQYRPYAPEGWTFPERPVFSDDSRSRALFMGEKRSINASLGTGEGKWCPHDVRSRPQSHVEGVTAASLREALYGSPCARTLSKSPTSPLEPLVELTELAEVDLTDASDAGSETDIRTPDSTPPNSDGYLSDPVLSPTSPSSSRIADLSNPYALSPKKRRAPPLPRRPLRLQFTDVDGAVMPTLSTPSAPSTPTDVERLTPHPALIPRPSLTSLTSVTLSSSFPLTEREELDDVLIWSDGVGECTRSRRRSGAQKKVRFAAAPRVTELQCSVYTTSGSSVNLSSQRNMSSTSVNLSLGVRAR